MKNLFSILLLIFLAPIYLLAQTTLESDVVASAGEVSTTSSFIVSWTIGEMAVETRQNASYTITEGFQQAYNEAGTSIKDVSFLGEISVYPVPVSDFLNFEIETQEKMLINATVYSIDGKKILEQIALEIEGTYTGQIDCSILPAGVWYLRFTNDLDETIKTFNVSKVR